MEKLLRHESFAAGEVLDPSVRGRSIGSHRWVIRNRFHHLAHRPSGSVQLDQIAAKGEFLSVPVAGNEVKAIYVQLVLEYLDVLLSNEPPQ